VTKKLDIWPALPIVVEKYGLPTLNMDNIIAALEHIDRVLKIDFRRLEPSPELENVVAVRDARAIPVVDISESYRRNRFDHSQFVLGWICTATGTPTLPFSGSPTSPR
jgi:hypothetical protein